ncbi:hypothetical protein LTR85_004621 [Meristemomyces frigidus]|nr:hypothetical protein LTR85_004621 [Meristemomyces frigidus]
MFYSYDLSGDAMFVPDAQEFFREINDMILHTAVTFEPVTFEPMPLAELRGLLHPAAATDPRDHVYSLLGLIPEGQADMIGTDYTILWDVVYAKATLASITFPDTVRFSGAHHRITGPNDFECLVHSPRLSQTSEWALPSWTIDFTRDAYPDSLKTYNADVRAGRMLPNQAVREHSLARFDADSGILDIEGVKFSRVKWVTPWTQSTPDLLNSMHEIITDVVSRGRSDCLAAGVDSEKLQRYLKAISAAQEIDIPRDARERDHVPIQPITALVLLQSWNEVVHLRPQQYTMESTDSKVKRSKLDKLRELMGHMAVSAGYPSRDPDGVSLSVFVTYDGYLGFAPLSIAEDDQIVLIQGAKLPMILRPVGALWTL